MLYSTNDLDIATLQILEEYLRSFKGCVIVISHDRYFMDKVVDHLLVFNGEGDFRDFPGDYTQYRQWEDEKIKKEREQTNLLSKTKISTIEEKVKRDTGSSKRKMTYKEGLEFQQLEKEIAELEEEKKRIEEWKEEVKKQR